MLASMATTPVASGSPRLYCVGDDAQSIYMFRGADFQTRHLRASLRAGEPNRVARALAAEAALLSTRGSPSRRLSESLAKQAHDLAERLDNPHVLGFTVTVMGVGSFLRGEWQQARERCARARRRLSVSPGGHGSRRG